MVVNRISKFGAALLAVGMVSQVFAADRLIIKYKPTSSQMNAMSTGTLSTENLRQQQMHETLTTASISALSASAGMQVKEVGHVGTGAHVVQLQQNVSQAQLQQIIQNIKSSPNVEYVEEDKILKPMTPPYPDYNPVQWDLQGVATTPTPGWLGDNFIGIWQNLGIFSPGESVVIAVIDTGYTPHPNFLSNLQGTTGNYGYQFISNCSVAGLCPPSQANTAPTQSYQANGLDQGDYLTQNDINSSSYWSGCAATPSSWHGSHVTGTLVAQGYSGQSGVLGGAYAATVLPVRVLGKCGGSLSDIENGMLWAAGYQVPNSTGGPDIPGSTTPAQVLSLSLGGTSACPSDMQTAINTITGSGTGVNVPIIVVAAGNENANVTSSTPANCQNVISVAATGPTGQLAYYSNWGNTTITAAGGDKNIYPFNNSGIYSTIWASPGAYNSADGGTYDYYEGTSMATPHVSAVVADIISYLRANSEGWTYSSIVQVLQNTAGYSYNNCSSSGCAVSGTLNAESALGYLQNTYSQTLTPSIKNISYTTGVPSSTVITFTNNQTSAVTVADVIITGNTSNYYSVTNQNCTQKPLAASAICNVTVSYNGGVSKSSIGAASTSVSQLELINGNSAIISSVSLTSGSGGGGGGGNAAPMGIGGCSAVANGDDYSLILLLLAATGVYLYRRKLAKHSS